MLEELLVARLHTWAIQVLYTYGLGLDGLDSGHGNTYDWASASPRKETALQSLLGRMTV